MFLWLERWLEAGYANPITTKPTETSIRVRCSVHSMKERWRTRIESLYGHDAMKEHWSQLDLDLVTPLLFVAVEEHDTKVAVRRHDVIVADDACWRGHCGRDEMGMVKRIREAEKENKPAVDTSRALLT